MSVNKAILLNFGLKEFGMTIIVQYKDGNTVIENRNLDIDATGVSTFAALQTAARVAVMDYATLQGYTALTAPNVFLSYDAEVVIPAGLASAPQTAISAAATNAATNLATNYNLLSGVLGVADGLNAGNTAQNDLATKYNALATKFNTLITHLQTLGLQA